MKAAAVKLISAAILLCVSLLGSFLSLRVEAGGSPAKTHIAYCFASGVLIAVAVVHMLAESAEELEEAGVAFSKAFGGDGEEAFPLGTFLFICGFALIVIIEALLHHKLGAKHEHSPGVSNGNMVEARERLGVQSVEGSLVHADSKGNAGGWAALTGLSIHSVVEGLAAGSVAGAADVSFVLLAIACHKGFAAFALSAANLSLYRTGKSIAWYAISIWFALSGSLGIIIGMVASANIEGPAAAGITCVAAGTLLSVGINEMLMPALASGALLSMKLVAFVLGLFSMSILAVWA